MIHPNKTFEYNIKDGKNIYFTSDTHFGHANILNFCKRPFKDVDEMNEELIKRWNEVISKEDTVFHLGDFAFGGAEIWNKTLPRLNGHIVLILGNHKINKF